MGAPAHEIKYIVEKNDVAVFSSNYALYGDMSARVMHVLGQFAPDIEVYSIDEAFLDLTGMEHLGLDVYGKHIIRTVQKSTGIPVSIGIAKTKTLAKLANKLAKKIPENKGVCVLDSDTQIEAALKIFPIDDVWGIGRQHAKRLYIIGVKTAYDFIQLSRVWVHKNMSIVGLRLWEELRGKSCYDLELTTPAQKTICTSRSFGIMLTHISDIEEAIASHAASCAEKLRRQKSCASVITIFIATNPFRPDTPQYSNSISITLPHATNDSADLIRTAKTGLKHLFREKHWYKKAGIIVSELTPEDTTQINLFRNLEDDAKHRKLMHAFDAVNQSMGKNSVKIAAQGQNKRWKLRQEKLSPHYTTRLREVVLVKG